MSPITHLLLGWEIACAAKVCPRDRNLLCLASVAPDVDGLGLVADLAVSLLGLPATSFYASYHHVLFHGLFGCVLVAAIAVSFAQERLRVLVLTVVVFHLHLLCDLLGSAGPGAGNMWPIQYLGPFSDALTARWDHQWELNAWPNILLSLGLLGLSCRRAIVAGHSPMSLFSPRVDRAVVATLRAWHARISRRA